MRSLLGLIGTLAVVWSVGTACGSASSGMPSPSTGTPSHSGNEPQLPYAGAPKVPNPVDVSRFKSMPCTTLSAKQLQVLGVPEKSMAEPNNPTGPSCSWQEVTRDFRLTINFLTNSDGLSSLFAQQKEEKKFAVFKPILPVNGFPAVLDLPDDARRQGFCSYAIGVNDRDVMFFQLSEPPGGNPCDDVRQVALSATKTVQAAGS